MLIAAPSLDQLSTVISQVTGPAFLLAAEAQLLTVLVSRLDRIVDRSRELDAPGDPTPPRLAAERPILKRRATLMHRSIYWTVGSSIVTSLLVILGFGTALLRVPHEYGAAFMFAVAMALFTAGLVAFAREVRLAFSEIDPGATPPRTRGERSYPHA